MTTKPSPPHQKRRYKTYAAYEESRWAARSGEVTSRFTESPTPRVSARAKRVTCKKCHRPGNVWFKTVSGDWKLAIPDPQGRIWPCNIDPCFRIETGRYLRAIR